MPDHPSLAADPVTYAESIPLRYRALYLRACSGHRPSARKATCLECVGYCAGAVDVIRQCSDDRCPDWPTRPYQVKPPLAVPEGDPDHPSIEPAVRAPALVVLPTERATAHATTLPTSMQGVYLRAASGNRPAARKARCLECVAYSEGAVRDIRMCTCRACPNWKVRPYQVKSGNDGDRLSNPARLEALKRAREARAARKKGGAK